MKKVPIILLVLLFSSCTKVVDTLVGEANMNISQTFSSDNYSKLQIKLNSESYCSGNGVELQVIQNNNSIYTSIVQSLPFDHAISITQNANIEFKASSIELNNGVTCKRLGNAKIEVFIKD